jgi:hypothetical protein
MLECYFDDSADSRRERFCASGGLIGSEDQWDSFVTMWSHHTSHLKEPFRSTECECGHGQFSHWEKPKRDGLMANLVTVIQTAGLPGFASVVPVQAYKRAFPNCRHEDPYLLTIPHAIINMALFGERINSRVNFWFESGAHNGAIHRCFDKIKRLPWERAKYLGGITFHSKALYPLQSADLIAREAFKHLDNLGIRPMRKPLRRFGEHAFFIAWTEEALHYLAAHGGPQNLELLASWDEHPDAPPLAYPHRTRGLRSH